MRLVYQTAQKVIVWLGASDYQIDCLFHWITALDKNVLTMSRPHTISTWEVQWAWVVWQLNGRFPPDEIRKALSVLLRRDWFSRIWVLQEAAMAKSAVIKCGWKEVNSRAFVVMPSLLNIGCSESEQARLDILPGLLREKSWWAGGSSKNLLTLLQKFGRSKASDPRDIIYALLGLSGDAYSSDFLRPDYQISIEEVIQQSVAYFMTQTHDLPAQILVQSLPKWGIDEFLDALPNPLLHVLRWATDNEKDLLLYDLLAIQKEKKDLDCIHECLTYAGRYGLPIAVATKNGNLALMELIFQFQDPNNDISGANGKTLLMVAMKQGNLAVARLILGFRPYDVHVRDSMGNTPLFLAVQQGNLDFVELLLQHPEVDISARNLRGETPLLAAVERGHSAVAKLILNSPGFAMCINGLNGVVPLIGIAVRQGHESIVDLLLQKSPRQHAAFRGSDGLTLLETALFYGFSGIVKKLLAHNRGVIHDAVRENKLDFVQRILDVEPSLLEDCSIELQTPLGAAAQAGKTGIVSSLLDKGANINFQGFDHRTTTPLYAAASCGHLDTVKLLVERGANIDLAASENAYKTTALWGAASKGSISVAMYLLKAGAKVEVAADDPSSPILKDVPGSQTVFWAAIYAGQTEAVKILSEGGVDLEMSVPWISYPLMQWGVAEGEAWAKPIWIAASLGHTDIVRLCIQRGVNIEARDSFYGMTPFWRAAFEGQPEVMRALIAGGADVRARPVW